MNKPHGMKKGKSQKTSARGGRPDHLAGFAVNVNRRAGPSASGVRVGFPAERTVTLNYVGTHSLYQAVAGVTQMYQYRLNSVFDPDLTGVGHQPMGFDQWAAFYNHYVVESVEYDIEMSTREASEAFLGVHISDDPSVPNDPATLIELGAVATMYQPNAVVPHIFKGRVDIAKFFNRTAIASDSDLRAGITGNPIDQAILTLWSRGFSTATQITADHLVRLSYRVRFMEPKDLPPSLLLRPGGTSVPKDLEESEFEYVRMRKPSTLQYPTP